MESYEQYKIILLGEPGVGKTSFFFRVRDGVFLGNSVATVSSGVEHLEYEMKIDDTRIKAHLYDTAGGERFRTLTSNYFQNTDAAILMFSVEDQYSFERLEDEIDNAKQFLDKEDFVWALVGHKSDLDLDVDQEGIRSRATGLNTKIIYASAKTGDNVIACLEEVIRRVHVVGNPSSKNRGDSIQLQNNKPRPHIRKSHGGGSSNSKSGCC